MEECELCGKRANDIYIVSVEEVELRVCAKCAQGKRVVSKVLERSKMPKSIVREKKSDYEQLVDNYGTLIHNARESMKIPIKVLAEMLNEKETLLLHIEQQKTMPSEALRKKLERALSIRLIESDSLNKSESDSRGGGDRPTIGDFISA